MNIPTAHSRDSLERFLAHIQTAEIPEQVTRRYLKQHSFMSGNDPELRHIGRLLGFLNERDEPQKLWKEYKEQGVVVLKAAVLQCYEGVFNLFPDAPERTEAELTQWFRPPLTGETHSSVERAIRTFRKLCEIASITSKEAVKRTSATAIGDSLRNNRAGLAAVGAGPIIIQPPNFKDEADYVRFFRALKQVFYE